MKFKYLYRIVLATVLILVLLPACGTSNEVVVKSPQVETSSPVATIDFSRFEIGTYEFEGKSRDYLMFLPGAYSGATELPLVIYLHAYGWNVERDMEYVRLHEVADANNFVVVYPDSAVNWNSGIGDNPASPTFDVDDVGFIEALIDTLKNRYSINPEMIYATGFSNGGFMAYRLACQLSDRIAAIASVGGVISASTLEECDPIRPIPVLEIHGTKDSVIPIDGNQYWPSIEETIDFWTNFNNCTEKDTTSLPDLNLNDGSFVEKISYINCTNNSEVILYNVIDGGHTWPGAGPAGFSSAGNTNQDINAGNEIWSFLKEHQLALDNN